MLFVREMTTFPQYHVEKLKVRDVLIRNMLRIDLFWTEFCLHSSEGELRGKSGHEHGHRRLRRSVAVLHDTVRGSKVR